jgi:hypothetical protein
VGSGRKVRCLNATLQVSYELKENLFIDGGYLFRKFTDLPVSNTVSLGIRWNAARREYNY